jgi:hypothetical protein
MQLGSSGRPRMEATTARSGVPPVRCSGMPPPKPPRRGQVFTVQLPVASGQPDDLGLTLELAPVTEEQRIKTSFYHNVSLDSANTSNLENTATIRRNYNNHVTPSHTNYRKYHYSRQQQDTFLRVADIRPASLVACNGRLRIGDEILEVNRQPLARLTVEKAR